MSKVYEHKVSVINIVTAPEIEMLIIHSEGAYEKYKRSGKKPSDYCNMDLKMHDVKSYDFVQEYFADVTKLVDAIKRYRKTANIPKGEYTLLDLMNYIK